MANAVTFCSTNLTGQFTVYQSDSEKSNVQTGSVNRYMTESSAQGPVPVQFPPHPQSAPAAPSSPPFSPRPGQHPTQAHGHRASVEIIPEKQIRLGFSKGLDQFQEDLGEGTIRNIIISVILFLTLFVLTCLLYTSPSPRD